jgi:hypothetical protein
MLQSLQFSLVVEDVPKFSSHLVALLTILEHWGVDQPLEVRNGFFADEETNSWLKGSSSPVSV